MPRPENPGAATETEGPRRAWLEGADRRIAELQGQHPDRRADDEARLVPKPVPRWIGVVKGKRPAANGRTKSEWINLFGFVSPAIGRNPEPIPPGASTD